MLESNGVYSDGSSYTESANHQAKIRSFLHVQHTDTTGQLGLCDVHPCRPITIIVECIFPLVDHGSLSGENGAIPW